MLERQKLFRLMVIFPFIGGTAIGGFGIARLVSGEYSIATFDLAVGLSFYSIGVYTYLTGKEVFARYLSSVISLVGPLYFLQVLSDTGIFWVYSSTIVFYYLIPSRHAIAVSYTHLTLPTSPKV